uniref:Transposase n=5 Tax=unclassified Candidatus Kentrum TaxID=2643149 RepID=A0A450Z4Q3_9GAMM|nr:MAG: transposase [Candidatus Kentron sp. SD]
MANLPPCIVAMEACGGANHWYRVFTEMGHTVRLIAPQFVKPFVKSNKNDAADAEAICEPAQRPSMRFVSPKSIEQQDIQSIHRIREQFKTRLTGQTNQIRGLLLEYGIAIPQGTNHLMKQLLEIIADEGNGLTPTFRESLNELCDEVKHLQERIISLEKKLGAISKQNQDCQLLMTIPGIGLLTATALLAAIGDPSVFKSARELAAWLGLVPRQSSTGGKSTLLGISKRGDKYLRALLVHGGRSVVRISDKHVDSRSQWITRLRERRGENICAVAVANKNARTAWAVLTKKRPYALVSA